LEADAPEQGPEAAVFYSLAEGYDRSLFAAAVASSALAAKAIEHTAFLTSPWRDKVPEIRRTVADVRRRSVSDATTQELIKMYSLDWANQFEQYPVQVRECTVHGDLHGGNILVDSSGAATLIDYGDVGAGSAALDPITLELSFLFHPDGPMRDSVWPPQEGAERWKTGDYLTNCPMPDVIKACWRWTDSVCAGYREVAATAYGYLMRLLKYTDTKKQLAFHLLAGVRRLYADT